MDATLRPGRPEDANTCGAICYEAFKAIASQHNFPPDFPSREAGVELLSMLLAHPGFLRGGCRSGGPHRGNDCLDERSTIAGLGPITVDPSVQNSGVGRRLMDPSGPSSAAPPSRRATGASSLPQSLALLVRQARLCDPRAPGADAGGAAPSEHPG